MENNLVSERLQQAFEYAMLDTIKKGDIFKMPYESRIDVSSELKKAYSLIDYPRVYKRITELLEEELAQKIVNKIVSEMGTDIKKLMESASIREDFRYLMRKGVENILEKVKE